MAPEDTSYLDLVPAGADALLLCTERGILLWDGVELAPTGTLPWLCPDLATGARDWWVTMDVPLHGGFERPVATGIWHMSER
jgi:hypothetical protein